MYQFVYYVASSHICKHQFHDIKIIGPYNVKQQSLALKYETFLFWFDAIRVCMMLHCLVLFPDPMSQQWIDYITAILECTDA